MSLSPVDPPLAPEAAPEPRGPRGPDDLNALARRIFGRTTDLIVIGMLLVGGLTLGRQLVEWWHVDPPVVAASSAGDEVHPWSHGGAPAVIEFGDLPLSLGRQEVAGTREAALERLTALCIDALKTESRCPALPGDAPRRVLELCAHQKPVAEEPGRWQVFHVEAHFALAVGVRHQSAPSPSGDKTAADAAPAPCLVCWGLLAPLPPERWLLYTFLPQRTGATAHGPLAEIALPPGAGRILGMRGESGAGIIGFRGRGDPEQWIEHFEQTLEGQGYRLADRPARTPGRWSAHFQAADNSRPDVRVQFTRVADGSLAGIIHMGS